MNQIPKLLQPGLALVLPSNSPWRSALITLFVVQFWLLILYRDTALSMVQIWARSDTFAHAFLVLPISLWLIWRQRVVLSGVQPKAENSPLLFVVCIGMMWLLGALASVNALTQLSLVALLVLTVPTVLGWAVTRIILFPLGFLFFSVPLGEFLMPQLMDWTAKVTVFSLRLSGIPVYQEGLQFYISSGHWSVVEACSGIRYLIASVTVGTLFSYLGYTSTKRRILFVLVSILVPVIANWMRAYLIVLLGHLSGNKLAAGVDHLIYGWVFFGVVIFSMFIIGARWSEPELVSSSSPNPSSSPMRSVVTFKTLSTALLLALLVSLPHGALLAYESTGVQNVADLKAPQALAPGWETQYSVLPSFKPNYKNATTEMNHQYAQNVESVGLYLGFYQRQTQVRKLISFSNSLVASQDAQWSQFAQGQQAIAAGDAHVNVTTVGLIKSPSSGATSAQRLLVWQFYWIGGVVTTNNYLAKAYALYRRLTGHDDDSAVIVIYTQDDQTGLAAHVLEKFMGDNYDTVNSLLASLVNN
jgi:exosortase A